MRTLVAFLLLCGVIYAEETPKERARTLFKDGEAAYSAGKYDLAISKYTEAFSLVPVPLLLFDLGQAYRLKGERAKAIESYRKYLDVDANGKAAPEAREQLAALNAEIEKEAAQKRAAEAAEAQHKAAEAQRAAAEATRKRQEEEARQKVAEESIRQRREAERRAGQEKAIHDAELRAEAKRRDAARPVWKKPWFWGTVAAAVVVVGVSVGVGVAFGTHERDPSPTFGQVMAP